jgi:hypothetical protein
MRRTAPRLWAWALLGILVLLTPLAYCTPPDPVWVGGVFDDDDNDNGVLLVTSSSVALDPFPLGGLSLFGGSWPALPGPGADPDLVRSYSSVDVRAPPAA